MLRLMLMRKESKICKFGKWCIQSRVSNLFLAASRRTSKYSWLGTSPCPAEQGAVLQRDLRAFGLHLLQAFHLPPIGQKSAIFEGWNVRVLPSIMLHPRPWNRSLGPSPWPSNVEMKIAHALKDSLSPDCLRNIKASPCPRRGGVTARKWSSWWDP